MFGTKSSRQLTALAASRVNRVAKISAVTRRLWDAILVTDDGFGARMCKKCAQSHRFGLGSGWGGGGDTIWGGIIHGCAPAGPPPPLPPPWYPVMYSPPLICGTGYPSASAASPSPTAAVLCSASCGIPSPHPCSFATVRAGQGGRRTRPPPPAVEQDGFRVCHTHTHTLAVDSSWSRCRSELRSLL